MPPPTDCKTCRELELFPGQCWACYEAQREMEQWRTLQMGRVICLFYAVLGSLLHSSAPELLAVVVVCLVGEEILSRAARPAEGDWRLRELVRLDKELRKLGVREGRVLEGSDTPVA